MDVSNIKWRRSSRSTSSGGNCVELGALPSNAAWRKSSRSGSNAAECVELAGAAEMVAVRDSKDPDGPVLLLTRLALRKAVQTALTAKV